MNVLGQLGHLDQSLLPLKVFDNKRLLIRFKG